MCTYHMWAWLCFGVMILQGFFLNHLKLWFRDDAAEFIEVLSIIFLERQICSYLPSAFLIYKICFMLRKEFKMLQL